MRNEQNDVYVFTALTSSKGLSGSNGGVIAENTSKMFKITDGFKAKDIQYCTRIYSAEMHTIYFYVLSEDNDVYKITIKPGVANSSESLEYKVPLTCTTEKLDFPETVSKLVVTEEEGNYALTSSGNVYAWYNTAAVGATDQDYISIDSITGEDKPSISTDHSDKKLGFSDGERHDTPTKLPVSNISQIVDAGANGGVVVYLSNDGDVYRVDDEVSSDTNGKIIKLDNLSGTKKLYRVENLPEERGGDNTSTYSVEIFGVTADNELVKYKLDCKAKGSIDKKFGTLDSSAEPISVAFGSGYINGDTILSDDDLGNYVFKLDDGSYVRNNHNSSDLQKYADVSGDVDYKMIVGNLWFSKDNKVDYYSSTLDKIPNTKIAENIKEVNLIKSTGFYYDTAGFEYLNIPESARGSMIYANDGSVKVEYYSVTNDSSKSSNTIQSMDVDASVYGNGTRGVLVPTSDGKYNVCTKGSSAGESKVVDTIEIPD